MLPANRSTDISSLPRGTYVRLADDGTSVRCSGAASAATAAPGRRGFALAAATLAVATLVGLPGLGHAAMLSFLAAMIVTAFDLGADPYFVYTLKAWIMAKTDGAWFGETVQGFFGWVFVAFVIVFGCRISVRQPKLQPVRPFLRRHAMVLPAIYAAGMVFQVLLGNPVEIRTIAAFAMGIPLLCALAGFQHWRAPGKVAP